MKGILIALARRVSGLAGDQLLPQSRMGGPMPWVIAIMIALTTITAAGGLALANVAGQARGDLSGMVTVQIVEAARGERERQATAAIARLRSLPVVEDVRRVPDEEIAELLDPWLGDALGTGRGDGAIAVPALIDVSLSGAATGGTLDRLRRGLRDVAPAARIDAQAGWLRPVLSAIRSLQWLAGALILLLALSSLAAVWLAARSALGTNRETIEVVHHLGGTDLQIARIFQRSVSIDATLGALAGFALGLAAIFFLGRQFADLGSGMVAGGGLEWKDWLIIALIPMTGVVLAGLTARLTVLAALRRML